MTQPGLFDPPKVKMSRQCKLILELFKRQGSQATNVEMSEIALRYSARIWELCRKGFDIQVIEKRAHGVRVYELKETLTSIAAQSDVTQMLTAPMNAEILPVVEREELKS